MRFDNVLSLLIDWCETRSREYTRRYEENRTSHGYIPYLVTGELQFKLSALLERDFSDYESFMEEVLKLLDVHYDRQLEKFQNKTQKFQLERVHRDFLAYFETFGPESAGKVPERYWRVILGDEAERLMERFRTEWDYEVNAYWYPLSKCGRGERLFLMEDIVETREEELQRILGLPGQRMYRYGESNYNVLSVAETDDLIFYSGLESVYTDKDFTWLIYCSHEQTVTFAGSIVPKVKELFAQEKEYWDRFVWDFEA